MIEPLIVKFVSIIFGPLWALWLMEYSYKKFDKMTPFNTEKELKHGNIAVGIVVASVFISAGLCVAFISGMAVF